MIKKKKIIVADGVASQEFTIGQRLDKTTIRSQGDFLFIDKTLDIKDGALPTHAITKKQLDMRSDEIIDIIKNSVDPIADISFKSTDFVSTDYGYKYVIKQSDWGYKYASVGEFGYRTEDGRVVGVQYDPVILPNKDIEVHINTDPFDGVARVILGGLDPHYSDFAYKMNQMKLQINILENRYNNLIPAGEIPEASKYEQITYASDFAPVEGDEALYAYSIPYENHMISDPYVFEVLKLSEDGTEENILYTTVVDPNKNISIILDEKVKCKISIRSRS